MDAFPSPTLPARNSLLLHPPGLPRLDGPAMVRLAGAGCGAEVLAAQGDEGFAGGLRHVGGAVVQQGDEARDVALVVLLFADQGGGAADLLMVGHQAAR